MSWWEKGFYPHLTWTGPIHKLNKTAGELLRNIPSCPNVPKQMCHDWPASWCNSLQARSTANPLDAAESHPPGRQEERVEDMDEEETAGKTGCLSETQGKPEAEGEQALFYSCNCGESDHQYFMSEFIFNHFQKHSFFPSTEAKNQESSSYSENESGKRDVCAISYCLYRRKKSPKFN